MEIIFYDPYWKNWRLHDPYFMVILIFFNVVKALSINRRIKLIYKNFKKANLFRKNTPQPHT